MAAGRRQRAAPQTPRARHRRADAACRNWIVVAERLAKLRPSLPPRNRMGNLMFTTRRGVLAGGAASLALVAGCGPTGAGGSSANNAQLGAAMDRIATNF